jgi:hypothetical protein
MINRKGLARLRLSIVSLATTLYRPTLHAFGTPQQLSKHLHLFIAVYDMGIAKESCGKT